MNSDIRNLLVSSVTIVACFSLIWTGMSTGQEILDFAVIQPGQPGTPQDAQPVMDELAGYVEKKIGQDIRVKGCYINQLGEALDFMEATPPRWAIVGLVFYVTYATRYQMSSVASARPSGFDKDLWHLVVEKAAKDDWRTLRGVVWGTMLFDQDAAARLMFGEKAARLPFTLTGTFNPLRSLRAAATGKAAGVVLDRLQYAALKSLPLSENLKVIHTSKELPTSPVVWFGPPDEWTPRLSSVLRHMRDDPEAYNLLQLLRTEGFGPPDEELPKFRLDTENVPYHS
jgi:hypothetical protein